MSIVSIRAALEAAVMAITPAIDTVFEGGAFKLAAGSPYQGAYKSVAGQEYQKLQMLPADPDGRETGPNRQERGVFQVSLFYPLLKGPGPATSRAELIRATFGRGTSLTSGGVTAHVLDWPAIAPGYEDGDRWVVPVSIPYRAQVTA